MTRWLTVTLLVCASCGGSASETPWPVEPLEAEPGPAGEGLKRGNTIDVRKLPDNYSKPDAGAGKK